MSSWGGKRKIDDPELRDANFELNPRLVFFILKKKMFCCFFSLFFFRVLQIYFYLDFMNFVNFYSFFLKVFFSRTVS